MPPRRLLHHLLRHLLCLTMLAVAALPVAAMEILRVLAWPGYADADMVKDFEKRHNARVDVTVVSSDDVLWQKVSNPSGNFDVVAANSVEIGRYIAHNRLLPLHLEHIPNARGQRPRFRELQRIPGITQGAAVYAIPYTYAEMGLIYDRKQFAAPPDSIAALWDPRLRGKVLAFDGSSHNFSLAAQHLRLAPFRLEEGEFNTVARDLVALRRNVLTFYSLPEQSVELFRKYGAALMFANYGRQQLKPLQDAGLDVGYAIPREGALAWIDCWAVLRSTHNPELAEAWINYMLEPAVGTTLTQRQGLANTVSTSTTGDDAHLLWLQAVEDAPRRTALWGRIISGELPSNFPVAPP